MGELYGSHTDPNGKSLGWSLGFAVGMVLLSSLATAAWMWRGPLPWGLLVLLLVVGLSTGLAGLQWLRAALRAHQVRDELAESVATRRHAENAFLLSVLDALPNPTLVIHPDYRIAYLNREARTGTSLSFGAPSNARYCYQVLFQREYPCTGRDHPCPMSRLRSGGKVSRHTHRYQQADGSVQYLELETAPVLDAQGLVWAVVETATDVTQRVHYNTRQRQNLNRLSRIAHMDAVTRLPNRAMLKDRVTQALLRAARAQRLMAVMFVDLDRFKEINDSFGHAMGDELLLTVAERLKSAVRRSDTVLRFGGDEFVVLLEQIQSAAAVQAVADKILDSLAQPAWLADGMVQTGASLGVAFYPQDGVETDELLRHADAAMYRAKQTGRHRICFYQPALDGREDAGDHESNSDLNTSSAHVVPLRRAT